MKKVAILSFAVSALFCASAFCACPCGHNHPGHTPCPHNHQLNYSTHSSSSNSSVYLVSKDFNTHEEKFPNCDKHYMKVETTTHYYSDGSKRIYNNYTLFNSDGMVLESNCADVRHMIFEKKHYFIVRKNKGYFVINSNGETITKQIYSRIEEIKPNRLLVKLNKKYGIIDIKEKVIADIKYQRFERFSNDIFITKLNGYYGIINSDGKVLVKNDCEKIKQIHNAFLVKRYRKYGLVNNLGEITAPFKYDKVKKLGEYIILRKNKKEKLYDLNGNLLNENSYLKIKLQRNTLYGEIEDDEWREINL